MNLYEISESIQTLLDNGFDMDCIDYETGEILEGKAREKLAALELEESVKIENITLYIKNLLAETEAIKAEEKILASRKKTKENKINYLTNYISGYMQEAGKTRFESARCVLSFRKSEALEIQNEALFRAFAETRDKYLKYKEPDIDKATIKADLKQGVDIPGVAIVAKQNLQIK